MPDIVIDVAGEAAGVPGVAREFAFSKIDPTPPLVTLSIDNNTGITQWYWEILSQPAGATAVLSTPNASTTTFTPDAFISGTYLLQCTFNGGPSAATNAVAWKTRYQDLRVPAPGEETEFGADRGWDPAVEKLYSLFDSGKGGQRRRAVLDYVDCTAAPPTEVSGDRYILDDTVGTVNANWDGASKLDIVEFDGTTWQASTPEVGLEVFVISLRRTATYVNFGTPAWDRTTIFSDAEFRIFDDGDPTKQIAFQVSGLTASVVRTLTVPDSDMTLVGVNTTQTLTNKTLITPTIADFTNAQHDHSNAAGGGLMTFDTIYNNESGTHTIIIDDGKILFQGNTTYDFEIDISGNNSPGVNGGIGDYGLRIVNGADSIKFVKGGTDFINASFTVLDFLVNASDDIELVAADIISWSGVNAELAASGLLNINGGGASTNWVNNSLSMGHESSGHTSWIQSGDTGGTQLDLNPQGGEVHTGGNFNVPSGSYYKYNSINFAMADTSLNSYFSGGAGNLAATGGSNTAFGHVAASSLTTGENNTAFGRRALEYNTTGPRNSAFGFQALRDNLDGFENSAFGYSALFNNDSGYMNMAIGSFALLNNTTGNRNVAVGANAIRNNITSIGNVGIGHEAGENVTGAGNTFIGFRSGDDATSGSYNIIIGYDVDAPSATGNYQLNIGDIIQGEINTGYVFFPSGGLSTNWVTNSLSMGHDSSSHVSWIQSGDTGGTDLLLNPQGGNVGIGITAASYDFSIGSTDGSDQIGIYHDNSNAYFKWTDGRLYFETDEGSDSNTEVFFRGKGTGFARNRIYDEDNLEYLDLYCSLGAAIIRAAGTSPTGLYLQNTATSDVICFSGSSEGDTKELQIHGYNTGDANRSFGSSCQYGGEVIQHASPIELADDAYFDLPDATAGFGFFLVDDAEEYAHITWDSAAAVTLVNSSANVVTTDTDTKFCIFDNGTQVRVRNRLGAAKKVVFKYNYWTP